jgi:hypothetical protein
VGAQAAVGDAAEEVGEAAERGKQRLHTRVAEAQRRDGLAVGVVCGEDDVGEGVGAGRAGACLELGVEQAFVDLVADREQRLEVGVGEQPADAEVVAVIDGRLRAERGALLQVLLDLGVLVVHLQADLVAAVEDTRPEAAGRGRDHLAHNHIGRQQLHL